LTEVDARAGVRFGRLQDLSRGIGVTSPEKVSTSKQDQVKEIVSLLIKAAKAYQMYLPNNRMFIQSLQNLIDSLHRFFEENEALTLIVKEFELLYKGKTVYSDSDKYQSLAFRLYRDGIRLITFHQDVTTDEIVAFFDALTRALDADRIEDDLVTLLWEKDLHGITYYEVSDIEPSETASERPRQPSQEFKRIVETPVTWSKVASDVEKIKPTIALTTDEIREVQELAFATHDDLFLLKSWQVLAQCFQSDPSVEALVDLENAFIGFLNRCLANRKVALAADALSRIRIFVESLGNEQADAVLKRVLALALSEENLKVISDMLTGNNEVEHVQCLAYLSRLDEPAIAPILKMFPVCKNASARQTIISALSNLARSHPHRLLEAVQDESAEVIEGVLAVLEAIGSEDALMLAATFADHPAARIRGKVSSMLGNVAGERAVQVVIKLTDDPDIAVKRRALVSLVRLQGEEAVERIVDIFKSKEFGRLSVDSRMAILLTIRSLPPQGQRQVVEEILRTRRFFGKREIETTKIALIQVMHLLDRDVALTAIEQLIERSSGTLQKAARKCLKRMKSDARESNSKSTERV